MLGARRHDRIESLARELTARGGKATAVTTNVTDRQQVKELVDAAVQAYGRIDVIINNAGLMPQAPLERLQIDEWDRMIDVNIKAVLCGIAAALPQMKQQKAAHIDCPRSGVHFMGPALARLLGALLHVSGSIDDLQVRDAPEGQQCRPRSIAIVVPDLEQGNVVIGLGILERRSPVARQRRF